jgi:DNA replicative helicase MCM subunit Mcm2 (Cdc46/Mcm family)
LELQIKDGKVIQIKRVKPPAPPPPTNIDLIMTGRPKSLRDKLQTVLETLEKLANQKGMVPKDTLIAKLGEKGISAEEADKLIRYLERNYGFLFDR